MPGNDLTTRVENALIVPEDSRVAIIQPDLAAQLFTQRTYSQFNTVDTEHPFTKPRDHMFGPANFQGPQARREGVTHIKAGQTLIGMYGATAEILLQNTLGSATMMGIVHIPSRLIPLAEVYVGPDEYKKFFARVFSQHDGDDWKGGIWNARAHTSSIPEELSQQYPFLARDKYYWKPERVPRDIFKDGRSIEEQVAETQAALQTFITDLDAFFYYHMQSREDPTQDIVKERYEQMQRSPPSATVRLLGKAEE